MQLHRFLLLIFSILRSCEYIPFFCSQCSRDSVSQTFPDNPFMYERGACDAFPCLFLVWGCLVGEMLSLLHTYSRHDASMFCFAFGGQELLLTYWRNIYTDRQVSSYPRYTLDAQRSAQRHDPLAHRAQPQVSWEGRGNIKAYPIISDFQDHSLSCLLQTEIYLVGVGVLDCVVHRFLRDAVELLFDAQG